MVLWTICFECVADPIADVEPRFVFNGVKYAKYIHEYDIN